MQHCRFAGIVAFTLACCGLPALLVAAEPLEPVALEMVDVFRAGDDGYHTYRIPALIQTKPGTLLAIGEGRKTGRGDHGDLDLVQKRSTDGGQTWGPLELIYEE